MLEDILQTFFRTTINQLLSNQWHIRNWIKSLYHGQPNRGS